MSLARRQRANALLDRLSAGARQVHTIVGHAPPSPCRPGAATTVTPLIETLTTTIEALDRRVEGGGSCPEPSSSGEQHAAASSGPGQAQTTPTSSQHAHLRCTTSTGACCRSRPWSRHRRSSSWKTPADCRVMARPWKPLRDYGWRWPCAWYRTGGAGEDPSSPAISWLWLRAVAPATTMASAPASPARYGTVAWMRSLNRKIPSRLADSGSRIELAAMRREWATASAWEASSMVAAPDDHENVRRPVGGDGTDTVTEVRAELLDHRCHETP